MHDLISRKAVIDAIEKNACNTQRIMDAVNNLPSAQPERKKPVFKTGESVYHVSYADGTGGFKKKQMGRLDLP